MPRETEWSEHLDGFSTHHGYAKLESSHGEHLPSILWEILQVPLLLVTIGVLSALVFAFTSLVVSVGNWYRWSVVTTTEDYYNWTLYCLWSVFFALLSCFITRNICREAAGSGLPEMKTILSGTIKPVLLSYRLIVAKALGLSTALIAGLSVGKEGPLVHITAAIADQVMKLPIFRNVHRQDSRRLEILACACASGVAATFGTSYGSVLFSIELTSSAYLVRTLPKAFLSSVCAMLVFFSLGVSDQLALFNEEIKSKNVSPKWQEIVIFLCIGVISGILGVIFVYIVEFLATIRNRWLDSSKYSPYTTAFRSYLMVGTVSLMTSFFMYYECAIIPQTGHGVSTLFDFLFTKNDSSSPDTSTTIVDYAHMLPQLGVYFCYKFLATAVSVILPLPVGLFTPVFLTGGVLGRLLGELLATMESLTDGPGNFFPWEYSLLAAAGLATGVTRAMSTAVIVYELAGQPHLRLPISIVVVTAYFVGNRFSKMVYEVLIDTNGTPYMPELPKQLYHVPVAQVMLPLTAAHVLALDSTYQQAFDLLQAMDHAASMSVASSKSSSSSSTTVQGPSNDLEKHIEEFDGLYPLSIQQPCVIRTISDGTSKKAPPTVSSSPSSRLQRISEQMRRRRKHADTPVESGYKARRPAQWITASADKVQRAHSSDDAYYQSLQHLATTSTSSCDTLEDEAIRQEELDADLEGESEADGEVGDEGRLLPIASSATSFVSTSSSPWEQSLLKVSLSPATTSQQGASNVIEGLTDSSHSRHHAVSAKIFPNDNSTDALSRLEAGGSGNYPLDINQQPDEKTGDRSTFGIDGEKALAGQTFTPAERDDSPHAPPRHPQSPEEQHQKSANSVHDNHQGYQQEPRQHREIQPGNQMPQPAHGYRWKAYTPSVIPVVKSTRNMVIVGAVLTSDLRKSLQEMQRVLDIVSTPPVVLGRFDDLSFSEDITPSPPPKHTSQVQRPHHHHHQLFSSRENNHDHKEEDDTAVENERREPGEKITKERRYPHGHHHPRAHPPQESHDPRAHMFASSTVAHDAANNMLEQNIQYVVVTNAGRSVVPVATRRHGMVVSALASAPWQAMSLAVPLDPSPYQIVDTMHLSKVELLFRMLSLNQAYVTHAGKLVGLVTRASLREYLNGFVRRPLDRCTQLARAAVDYLSRCLAYTLSSSAHSTSQVHSTQMHSYGYHPVASSPDKLSNFHVYTMNRHDPAQVPSSSILDTSIQHGFHRKSTSRQTSRAREPSRPRGPTHGGHRIHADHNRDRIPYKGEEDECDNEEDIEGAVELVDQKKDARQRVREEESTGKRSRANTGSKGSTRHDGEVHAPSAHTRSHLLWNQQYHPSNHRNNYGSYL